MEIKDFTKYFNYGYFLAKYEPVFLKKLLNTTGDDSEIAEPIKAGVSQNNREKFLSKTKQISRKKNSKRGKDMDRNIDR